MAKSKKKKSKVKKKKSLKKSYIKYLFWLGFAVFLYLLYCFITLPNIEDMASLTRQPTTQILDDDSNEIATYGAVYAKIVYPEELPKHLVNAIISTEDRRFYEHFGFDIISFSRAMLANIKAMAYVQGGSTISQQVAKNLFLTSQKSIKRKIQELLLAFWLENKFSKEQILTLYLNRVYLGTGVYGVEAAANKYFEKNAEDINLLESAILAGMLKAPSRYNPIASTSNALSRAKVVLQNMEKNNSITTKEKTNATKMKIGHQKTENRPKGRYFADWIYQDVNAYIGERNQDVTVYTTLNAKLQAFAEKTLVEAIATNKAKNISQGAIVVMDKDGAVKAMVGGVNYEKSQFNRATQALRQAGSTFKPIVYMTALEEGFEIEDKLQDMPITIKNWSPKNYNKKYAGKVTLDYALINSLNLATIDLAQKFSGSKIISNAYKMGISTKLKDTPALPLGVAEVKMMDMITAYSVFANKGTPITPFGIKEVISKEGEDVFALKIQEKNRIFDKKNVSKMNNMLERVIIEGTGKKAKQDFFVAGKTGTTQDYKDAWFIGYSDDYIAAVWLGNDDNSPMKKISGGKLPAQIWQKIINFAHNEI